LGMVIVMMMATAAGANPTVICKIITSANGVKTVSEIQAENFELLNNYVIKIPGKSEAVCSFTVDNNKPAEQPTSRCVQHGDVFSCGEEEGSVIMR